jgi:hypothetical protein
VCVCALTEQQRKSPLTFRLLHTQHAQFQRLLDRVTADVATQASTTQSSGGAGDVYFTPRSTAPVDSSPTARPLGSAFPVAELSFDSAATPALFRGSVAAQPQRQGLGLTPPSAASAQPLPLAGYATSLSAGAAVAQPAGFKAAIKVVWARMDAMETALKTVSAAR